MRMKPKLQWDSKGPFFRRWVTEGGKRKNATIRILGTTTKKQAEKEMLRLWIERGNPVEGDPRARWGELADMFMKEEAHRFRGGTERVYTTQRKRLGHTFDQMLVEDMVGPLTGSRYQQARLKEGAENETINGDVRLLIRVLKWARKNRKIAKNPFEPGDVRQLKPRVHDEIFEEPEWATFYLAGRSFTSRRYLAAVEVLDFILRTGSRIEEVLSLSWGDVDFRFGVVKFYMSKVDRKKTLNLVPGIRAILERQPRGVGATPVFVNPVTGLRWKAWQIQDVFRRAMKASGLAPKDPVLTVHSTRHTVSTWLAAAGYTKEIVDEITGHKNGSETGRYTHLNRTPAALDAALNEIGAAVERGMNAGAAKSLSVNE